MASDDVPQPCAFDKLFTTNEPDVLEKIFFSLDFSSFEACWDVSRTWRELLTTEYFKKKALAKFQFPLLYHLYTSPIPIPLFGGIYEFVLFRGVARMVARMDRHYARQEVRLLLSSGAILVATCKAE